LDQKPCATKRWRWVRSAAPIAEVRVEWKDSPIIPKAEELRDSPRATRSDTSERRSTASIIAFLQSDRSLTFAFEVVDPQEPTFWLTEFGAGGERHAYPPRSSVPGFVESWRDRVKVVRRVFAE
jgi:hypothetical protein